MRPVDAGVVQCHLVALHYAFLEIQGLRQVLSRSAYLRLLIAHVGDRSNTQTQLAENRL